jgi:hypothetical protein
MAGLRRQARNPAPLIKVNEFGQPVDPNYVPLIEEVPAEDGIIELVPAEGGPGAAPIEDMMPVVHRGPLPAVTPVMEGRHGQLYPTERDVIDLPREPIGHVLFKANYMEIRIPVIGVVYSDPMIMIFTPPDAHTKFEPPGRAEGVELMLPDQLKGVPSSSLAGKWHSVYVTGFYVDIPDFGVRASIFYLKP